MSSPPNQGIDDGIASGGSPYGEASAVKSWPAVPELVRTKKVPLPPPWNELFRPLCFGAVDDLLVVGQIGQSLDGRVATNSGHSHYINGPAGLAHLHRLRAVVDAVVVGVGTAIADDPQLTVRRVAGPHPARVAIDPGGRLPANARMFASDGVRRLVMTADDARSQLPSEIEIVRLPAPHRRIAPEDILLALSKRGLRRVLIEGGAETVSRFLAAGCLDRLHVVVSPIIIGTGRLSFNLPPIERVHEALRAPMHIHRLDDEVLFDCDLSAQRKPIGSAKTSM
jgi:diaminohydroxyphosphoribosylaminopyrimidine deaminase/5-amino-6-(5-phosphoribosylamino)uracil reductase